MFFFYDDKGVRNPFITLVRELDPNIMFGKHYENYLFLKFIEQKTDNVIERIQAGKELGICEKKLAYWKRHPEFNSEIAEKKIASLKKMWR